MWNASFTAVNSVASMFPFAADRKVLIVFDLDGTIADSRMVARNSYRNTLEIMGFGRISDETADSLNGPTADEICRIMGIEESRRPLYNMLIESEWVSQTREIGCMFPGTARMLDALAPYACLSILTNGSCRACDACIEKFCIGPYISLHSGYVPGVTKAEKMLMWAEQISARKIICVGDRSTDVVNARLAGAVSVAVTYGMGTEEELKDADHICINPSEVAQCCLALIAE